MGFSYELRPHTADIRISLRADSFPELFQAAVAALADILLPEGCQGKRLALHRRVALSAPDSTALLVDFLSEVLWQSQVRKALFCRFRVHSLAESTLQGVLSGIRVQGFQQDVKAITYHEARVDRLPSGYWASLVVDV